METAMTQTIKPIDEEHIAIIETQVTEQLVAKIDEQLTLFVVSK